MLRRPDVGWPGRIPCGQHGRCVEVFRVHHANDLLEHRRDDLLIGVGQGGQSLGEPRLQWGRSIGEQVSSSRQDGQSDASAVLGVTSTRQVLASHESVDDPRDRPLAEVDASGQLGGLQRAFLCDDPKANQLWSGEAELTLQLSAVKIDGPNDSAKRAKHPILERRVHEPENRSSNASRQNGLS